MLFTKLEKPLFLRNGPGGFPEFTSPENRLGLIVPLSDLGGVTSIPPCVIVGYVRDWR